MSQALTLKIFQNGQLVEQKTLNQDVIKIGKLKSSHLCLEDDSVARMHAVIEVSGSDVRVIDLGSSTGSILNGRRVEKNDVLKSGDVLEFGPFRVEVEFTAMPAAAPMGVTVVAAAPSGPPVAMATMAPSVGQTQMAPMGAAPMVMPAAAPVQQRPVMQIDASEVEVQDGSRVTEVVTMYNRSVVDVQHVGQVKSRVAQAPVFLVFGGALFLAGAGVFAYDVTQDWGAYQEAARKAVDAGQQKPQEPGTGFAGLGIALALLGLAPFSFGVMRMRDRGLPSYTLGEGHHATFHAPPQGLPDGVAFPLVRGGDHHDYALQFTREMTGEVTLDGQRITLAELVSSGRAGAMGSSYSFPLPPGAHCRVQYGDLTFHVNSVAPGKVLATKSEADKPFWLYNAASLAVIGSMLVLVHLIPDDMLDMQSDETLADNRFVGYMNQPDEIPEEEPPPEQENSDDEAGGTGQRHKGEEGKMGKPTSKNKSGLYAMKGPKDAIPQMARNFDPDMMARNAGILGMVQQEAGHFLASPYGGAFAVGNDDEDVWGGLTGTEIGEAYGVGGLGLVGTGRGGGGTGEGTIGLGNVGLIGKGGGGGTGSGYGRGSGAGFGGRGTRVPRVRQAKAEVKGAIDKDIIRRIVRAHINEVRHCYNQGLVKDPNLKGRVAIQFTIGPSGNVPVAVVQESSIKDTSVGQCIAKAVKRWTFPKPDGGGNVVVTYPFVLEAG
ncbi:MAG: AgmX/PglI C-terminal domain-containing protein [Nannocystaceae bacterium]|nr:AgmX/PglI C-terminal domain-containing protein [Nannocystaceae bacterium]